ncbi:MAG: type III secretion system chaperone [Desulfovibrio sp.]|nr:type III secretion system chaperone [Desulfovibrio sp.]
MQLLETLCKKFAEDNGCVLEMLDNGHGGTFLCDPLRIRFMLQPGGTMLILQIAVGILPETNCEACLRRLLAANDLFHDSRGMTLGLNKDADVVTLQVAWDITTLNQKGFSNLVLNLIYASEQWIKYLAESDWANDNTSSEEFVLRDFSSAWMKI